MKIFLPPPHPESILIPFYNLQEKGRVLLRSIGYRSEMTKKLKVIRELGVSEKQLNVCRKGMLYFPKTEWDILTQGLYSLLKAAPKASPDYIGDFINYTYELYIEGAFNYQNVFSLAKEKASIINKHEYHPSKQHF